MNDKFKQPLKQSFHITLENIKDQKFQSVNNESTYH